MEMRRIVPRGNTLYDRTADYFGGQAVAYGLPGRRCAVFVNGVRYEKSWPDTAAIAEGDHGNPMAIRLRYDYAEEAWFIYYYMFMGDNHDYSEWVDRVF